MKKQVVYLGIVIVSFIMWVLLLTNHLVMPLWLCFINFSIFIFGSLYLTFGSGYNFWKLWFSGVRFEGNFNHRYSKSWIDIDEFSSNKGGKLKVFRPENPLTTEGRASRGHACYYIIGKEYALSYEQARLLFKR